MSCLSWTSTTRDGLRFSKMACPPTPLSVLGIFYGRCTDGNGLDSKLTGHQMHLDLLRESNYPRLTTGDINLTLWMANMKRYCTNGKTKYGGSKEAHTVYAFARIVKEVV